MDGQYLRMQLQALFSPASAALGRLLRIHAVDTLSVERAQRLREQQRRVAPRQAAQRVTVPEPSPDAFHALFEQGWRWYALGDPDYPPLLASIDDAPGVIAVLGDVSALHAPCLAVVGARAASADGRENSFHFSRHLAAAGFSIVSGLALGVDAHAHRGALETGRTVAVLGSGPGTIYPASNTPLAERIIANGGAIVSEFALGARPLRAQFPLRNRVISGLSLGVMVIEAAIRSGSLITARTALQQGREVFAVPGSIHNPLSKGCHQLLRDGANWLESEDDILHAFRDFQHSIDTAAAVDGGGSSLNGAPQTEPDLIVHLTGGMNTLDQLQQRSGLSVQVLAGQLAELEMAGWIERVAGGYTKRARR